MLRFGLSGLTRILLHNGANPTLENITGSTPLHLACRRGNTEVVQLLLNTKKVDVNAKDKAGWTPLHSAAGYGYAEVCEMLMDEGADVLALSTDRSTTPLHVAIAKGDSRGVNSIAERMLYRSM